MDARAEFEQLLTSLLDGVPDEAGNRRLDEILGAHPDLQEEYLEYMQLHALLKWRAGQVGAEARQPMEAEKSAHGHSSSENAAVIETSVFSRPEHWRRRTGVAAALVLMAASLAAFLIWQAPSVQATPDLVERLVDWNLDLTQARSGADRDRIYAAQAADIQATFAKAELPKEDRELAETLLQNGSWLVKNADPAAEAERFNDITDMVAARIDGAAAAQDEQRVARLAGTYQRLSEVGVGANVERAQAVGGLDAEKKQNLEQTTQRHAHRANQLVEMIERQPEPSRRLIRRAMKGHFHKTKKNQKSTE